MATKSLDIVVGARNNTASGMNSALAGVRSFASQAKGIMSGIVQGIGLSIGNMVGNVLRNVAATPGEWIEEAKVQADAQAKLRAVIEATGGAAGKTADELINAASRMQAATTFGDEAIVNMQAILATFKNVKGDNFDQAQQAILDLSATLGTDLQTSAIQVGKALENPIKGVTALGRAGVSFSESQKDTIKTLVESGKLMEAQNLILAEMKTQFGGVAEAMARTPFGKMAQMKNDISDLREELGMLIMTMGEKLIQPIRDFVAKMQEVAKFLSIDGVFGAIWDDFIDATTGMGFDAWAVIQGWLPKITDLIQETWINIGDWLVTQGVKIGSSIAGAWIEIASRFEQFTNDLGDSIAEMWLKKKLDFGLISQEEFDQSIAYIAQMQDTERAAANQAKELKLQAIEDEKLANLQYIQQARDADLAAVRKTRDDKLAAIQAQRDEQQKLLDDASKSRWARIMGLATSAMNAAAPSAKGPRPFVEGDEEDADRKTSARERAPLPLPSTSEGRFLTGAQQSARERAAIEAVKLQNAIVENTAATASGIGGMLVVLQQIALKLGGSQSQDVLTGSA